MAHKGMLEGKVAVVTGGASGIGRATAVLFASHGAHVVVGDINEEAGEETAASIRQQGSSADFFHTDVSRAEEMQRLMDSASEAAGGIDVIVNNAGLQYAGSVTDFEETRWDALMQVNAKSCFLAAKYGVPHLKARGGGAIVNNSSLGGVRGGPGLTAYSASKGAIVAFTKALAQEVARDGIRVNCVAPGWIDTPFNQPAIDFMGGRANQDEMVRLKVPMQRQGSPEEVSSVILFLASDASSYMTAQALIISGGSY